MVTYNLEIHGMMCGMCEAHVNDAVRRNFTVKKVSSDRKKNLTVVVSETELDTNKLQEVIKETGYELKKIEKVVK